MTTRILYCANHLISLVDADYLPYAYGDLPLQDAYERIDAWFEKIFHACNSRKAIVYIKKVPQDNFRYDVGKFKPYKGNREFEPPRHYFEIIDYIIRRWKGVAIKYVEVDDAIAQSAAMLRMERSPYVVVSDDKDMNMIPGLHLKHSKNEWINGDNKVFIREDFSMKNDTPTYKYTLDATGEMKLWLQMIVGDTSDNIAGVLGYGLNKAQAAGFEPGINPSDAKLIVWNLYKEVYGTSYREMFIENYLLLKLIDNSKNHNLDLCPITY